MNKFKWFKGSLHVHTDRSDGDSSPEVVRQWHRDHGYDFLVITDHNTLTAPASEFSNPDDPPLMIPGEEVTLELGEVPIHLNAIGTKHEIGMSRAVAPEVGTTVAETLQTAVGRIREAGGLAQINHPNYKWAFDDRAMVDLEGATFLEIANCHPVGNALGGGGSPGTEAMWDRLLTRQKRIWGVATDDAHHLTEEFSVHRGNPGRGWVMVCAEDLTQSAILEGLANGNFYASTGVELADVRSGERELALEIKQWRDAKYTTVFTGENGQELWRSNGLKASYSASRLDRYIRATVYASNGARAWTQPVWVDE